jgi:RHS repeat-associated protein
MQRFQLRCWLVASFWGLACGGAHADGLTKVTYYYTDPQGTVLATVDEQGNLLTTTDRRPYGEQALGDPQPGPGYAGHVDDPSSGLIYMQARYYDPKSARFLSTDPHVATPGNPMQFARYSYANNNPVANIDPDGRRAVVANGQIFIQPENGAAPNLSPIPNNVGAVGFGPADLSFHTYDVRTSSTLSLTQARDGLMYNPTPGRDLPASPGGTRNNVGNIPIMNGENFVRSFVVPSPNPAKYSDVVVNYTIAGEHKLAEGYVMRFGEKNSDGSTTLRSYGEGNNWHQNPLLQPIWAPQVDQTWQKNQHDIIDSQQFGE